MLRLGGTWQHDHMVLMGDRVGSDGKTRRLRVSLTPHPDGTLRQLQERSEDGGQTWAVIFEGRYERKAASTGRDDDQPPRCAVAHIFRTESSLTPRSAAPWLGPLASPAARGSMSPRAR